MDRIVQGYGLKMSCKRRENSCDHSFGSPEKTRWLKS